LLLLAIMRRRALPLPLQGYREIRRLILQSKRNDLRIERAIAAIVYVTALGFHGVLTPGWRRSA
jgi:hypothetical protein